MSNIYQTGVVGTITGNTLNMANPIQINMGASSSPILVTLNICKPLGGILEQNFQTGVVGIITGDTLKFANPIQINTGASSSPILVNLSIWEHRQSAKIQVNRPPLSVIQAAAFLKKEGTQDRQQPGTEKETDCPFVSFMELLLQSTVYGEWIFFF